MSNRLDCRYPISFHLQNILKVAIDEMLSVTGINKEEYYKSIDMEFDDYLKNLMAISNKIDITRGLVRRNPSITNDEINQYGEYIISISERLWILNHSLIFIIDYNKALQLPKVTKEMVKDINWDIIKNSIITFSTNINHNKIYLPSFIEYFDTDYTKVSGENREKIYRFRYNKQVDGSMDIGEVYNIAFTIEKLPKVFVENARFDASDNTSYLCNTCTNTHFRTDYTFEAVGGEIHTDNVCHLSVKRQCQCPIFQMEGINADVGLAIIYYISKMFEKRASLNRKNSRHIGEYKQSGDIELICSKVENTNKECLSEVKKIDNKMDKNKYAEVSLLSYAKQENSKERQYQVRCNITHNGHQSPREHYRKPHMRHYKNGKVTMIKGSIINKGKEKVIYRV